MKSMSKIATLAFACAFPALAAFAVNAPKTVKMDGWISETKCGVDHASLKGANPSCVAKCIKEGAKPVFIDDAKQNIYTISNPDAIKAHYGHHIQFTGTEDASTKTVHISKVTMLADQGAGTDKMMSK
jgi:hypothetical protein